MGFSDLHDYGTCDESHYYKQEGEYQQYYSKAYNYLDITDGRGYKPRQRWSRIGAHERGEVTNLASGGVGLVPPEMSIYFRALL